MTNVWGIHNDTLTTELVDEGFVSIGWDELGDLREIGGTREEIKAVLSRTYPDRRPNAIAGWAGILIRFRDEMQPGDIVVAPYKPDSTISLGVVSGDYEFVPEAETHRNRRRVDWKRGGVSRTVFSQPALYELGAFLTVFGIRKHDDEFRAALSAAEDASVEDVTRTVEAVAEATAVDEVSDEPRASRIDRHTRDFVLETLHHRLSHREFEEFTADLLRALGYQARVTAYSQDGGVDVIAHRDLLGVEPPLIKVQCKHLTGTIGAPEVQQLIGTQGLGELSLFVTLGSYSKEALAIERQRSGLRLPERTSSVLCFSTTTRWGPAGAHGCRSRRCLPWTMQRTHELATRADEPHPNRRRRTRAWLTPVDLSTSCGRTATCCATTVSARWSTPSS